MNMPAPFGVGVVLLQASPENQMHWHDEWVQKAFPTQHGSFS
jgi:hypothetical protein